MPPLPNVQRSYGPMLIGVFFNLICYGILVGQTLTYQQTYKKDSLWLRLFVLFLFCVETANTAIDMALMYQPLILEYGQKPIFFPTVFWTQPLSVVVISMPIQVFFAWRIYQLRTTVWIPLIISVVAVASFAGGLWTSVRIYVLKHIANKILLHDSELLWLLAACVADVIITVSLVLTLRGRKTGFKATDPVVDRIIRTTIQTGMITALFSIFDVVCFMAFPRDAINFVWDIALSKLYANCLMSSLNARQALTFATHMHVESSTAMRAAGSKKASEIRFNESVFACAPGPIEISTNAGVETYASATSSATAAA
ncbi:hypothetical protein C8R43DRAFT_37352 [Mycena crocata]|nr:hypothetical protein C8R43DRAFT_37352 [Mycena crocata]